MQYLIVFRPVREVTIVFSWVTLHTSSYIFDSLRSMTASTLPYQFWHNVVTSSWTGFKPLDYSTSYALGPHYVGKAKREKLSPTVVKIFRYFRSLHKNLYLLYCMFFLSACSISCEIHWLLSNCFFWAWQWKEWEFTVMQ